MRRRGSHITIVKKEEIVQFTLDYLRKKKRKLCCMCQHVENGIYTHGHHIEVAELCEFGNYANIRAVFMKHNHLMP